MFRRISLILLALLVAGAAHAAGPRTRDADTRNERDIARATEWIKEGKYERSIRVLKDVAERDPENADAWNMLGYAHRKMGQLEESAEYYERALTIDPDHKGALEYQGELFLMRNDVEAAKGNLERLKTLCPEGCEELSELEAAIAAHGKGAQPARKSRW